jgi:hypothetical protein
VGCHPRSTTKEKEESGEKDKEEKAASLEKPRSGVQDVSQEEIGEKRAVTVTENVKGAAGAETPLAQKEENGQQNPAERKDMAVWLDREPRWEFRCALRA